MNLIRQIGKTLGYSNAACRGRCFQKIMLAPRAILSIQPSGGSAQQVACRGGVLWITQEGQYEDIILQKGQRITLRGRGKIMIEALGASSILMMGSRQPV